MTIQWYPGHMARAKRMIEEELKVVDGILEVVDARVPVSSRNPDLQNFSSKPRIVALTKIDLADPNKTKQWVELLSDSKTKIVPLDLMKGSGLAELRHLVKQTFTDLRRVPRLLVVGIPNVGKSTLINRLTKRRGAQVGARPGVTKGKQWLSAEGMQLLDSPGILWPKFDDQEVARRLALVASIRDEIFDQAEIAHWLLNFLAAEYHEALEDRYGELDSTMLLDQIGQKRGCLLKGGIVDYNQVAALVLKDFRTGKLGRVTLDQLTESKE
ncbi:MAG: ribosome biogenesis GTPase YlqF [Bacillota bacterium]|nr:ribosome biogenesis GTPase YlqF [Bacillota bacterium]HHU60996.1 ribosome biogenesis GTPase YlqF [Natronincola sp.]